MNARSNAPSPAQPLPGYLPVEVRNLPKEVPARVTREKLETILAASKDALQSQALAVQGIATRANILLGFVLLTVAAVSASLFGGAPKINHLVGATALGVLVASGALLVGVILFGTDQARIDPTLPVEKLEESDEQLKWMIYRTSVQVYNSNEYYAKIRVKVFAGAIAVLVAGLALLTVAYWFG